MCIEWVPSPQYPNTIGFVWGTVGKGPTLTCCNVLEWIPSPQYPIQNRLCWSGTLPHSSTLDGELSLSSIHQIQDGFQGRCMEWFFKRRLLFLKRDFTERLWLDTSLHEFQDARLDGMERIHDGCSRNTPQWTIPIRLVAILRIRSTLLSLRASRWSGSLPHLSPSKPYWMGNCGEVNHSNISRDVFDHSGSCICWFPI